MDPDDDLDLVKWEKPATPAEPPPPAQPPALTAPEHYLRSSAALALAAHPGNQRRPNLVTRLLTLADLHARLALIPEAVAAEARSLYAGLTEHEPTTGGANDDRE